MSYPDKLFIYYIRGKVTKEFDLPDYIGCWLESGDSFLFFSNPHDELIDELVEKDKKLELKDRFEVDYFDWIGGKIDSFEVGGIKIIPIWEDVNTINQEDIVLDPGVVFGSGQHATTHNCLIAIDYVFSKDRNIKQVLDLGCGTGILSLFCARLGAEKILAVDLNPLAVKAVKKNIILNKLEDKILPVWGSALDFSSIKSHLLVANMHFDVICQVTTLYNLNNFRWLILSGIFPHQLREIENILLQKGVYIDRVVGHSSGWPTIIGRQR